MGLDLALLPFENDHGYSHSVIQTERRRELFEAIMEATDEIARNVPERFNTYLGRSESGDAAYENTQQTPYGEPLKWVPPKALLALAEHPGVTDNDQNRAVWAYLRELRDYWRIALYWH